MSGGLDLGGELEQVIVVDEGIFQKSRNDPVLSDETEKAKGCSGAGELPMLCARFQVQHSPPADVKGALLPVRPERLLFLCTSICFSRLGG